MVTCRPEIDQSEHVKSVSHIMNMYTLFKLCKDTRNAVMEYLNRNKSTAR